MVHRMLKYLKINGNYDEKSFRELINKIIHFTPDEIFNFC